MHLSIRGTCRWYQISECHGRNIPSGNCTRVSTLSRYPMFVMEREMDGRELEIDLQKAICGAREQFVEVYPEGEELRRIRR